jgi:hypothetical protein
MVCLTVASTKDLGDAGRRQVEQRWRVVPGEPAFTHLGAGQTWAYGVGTVRCPKGQPSGQASLEMAVRMFQGWPARRA